MTTDPTTEAAALAAAVTIIRAGEPDAVSARLEPSLLGFTLVDVTRLDEEDLSGWDPDILAELQADTAPHLAKLTREGGLVTEVNGFATVAVMTPREAKIRAAEQKYEASEEIDADTAERFLLVEKNLRGCNPPHYLTTHATLAGAGQYTITQEYASDWGVVEIIDLDTGDTYDEDDFVVTVAETPDDRWANDLTQFARLLAEINATQDTLDFDALSESMGLELARIDELFDRADTVWEAAKARLGR